MKHRYCTLGCFFLIVLWMAAWGCGFHGKTVTKKGPGARGSYAVIGIGPGDPDLLTSRALTMIREADVVFCRLRTREQLASCVDFSGKKVVDGYQVLFRYYGKDCNETRQKADSRAKMSCEAYHQKQAEFAALVRADVAEGKHVVLLSGGDPTIYGPDIWSIRELYDLNPVVVPGLSSFNAANAALKVSLGEVVLTAPFQHENKKDTIEQLAENQMATLVIFMPRNMDELFSRLASVCPADTPAAIVRNAGKAGSETVLLRSVGEFNATGYGADTGPAIVYVGKSLANAQYMENGATNKPGQGKYWLVGVGPGDADLATVRALDVIKKADLIFAHERISDKFGKYLAGKTVVNGYHRLFPYYGKKCEDAATDEKPGRGMDCETYHQKQAEFSAMVRKAVAQGKTVAMLDSGDPLVYGPCSWSLTELRDFPTEVVPGVSCFNAANAALGVGVTEGTTSHSVILASGWTVEKMAAHQATMVLFTMRTDFQKFIDSLSMHYSADTPVAIVQSAGYVEKEKVIQGKLGTIMDQTGKKKLPFEYLLYVGDFLGKREMLLE